MRHRRWFWLACAGGAIGGSSPTVRFGPGPRNASEVCEELMRGFGRSEVVVNEARFPSLWGGLSHALALAKRPAVMIFCNGAHYKLAHNFMCGLVAAGLEHVVAHVVLWCADEASYRSSRADWRRVQAVRLALGGDVSGDAPFKEARYARMAAVKALMPWAAAALGFDALTQDADLVWRGDVLARVAELDAAMMPDSNRVDPFQRPCKRKEAARIDAYAAHHGRSSGDCAAYRCVSSVNGGFVYARARSSIVAALRDWFERCPTIVADRENQPSLVAALEERVPPGGCVYGPTRKDAAAADLVVMGEVVSGQRPAVARDLERRGRLLAFHCNFRSGCSMWRRDTSSATRAASPPTSPAAPASRHHHHHHHHPWT
ncbi:hypothetical protein CTAYLR_002496 [Chrysophaeum taylorii]|uniref:Nucleotide-diphospho-sugar transferase domain-containing protein n=1 Tax=Chrysophaeum taylorii TaxID=2483200 RepID=A0AAD7XPW5_9STRA|nr:hypothetical protein CTAYLR_002496 [Chrysophaeum taylorii]